MTKKKPADPGPPTVLMMDRVRDMEAVHTRITQHLSACKAALTRRQSAAPAGRQDRRRSLAGGSAYVPASEWPRETSTPCAERCHVGLGGGRCRSDCQARALGRRKKAARRRTSRIGSSAQFAPRRLLAPERTCHTLKATQDLCSDNSGPGGAANWASHHKHQSTTRLRGNGAPK